MINQNKMTFFEHLNELRNRILISISFVFVFSLISYYYSSQIIDFLIYPVQNNNINFQVLKITSVFFVKMGISIASGILFSFPFIMFQFFKFVSPAFQKVSIFKICLMTVVSYLMFLIGLTFGYKVIIPFSITFFSELSLNLDFLSLNYTLENYLSYISWILIVSSLIFQLPFILTLIVKFGLLSLDTLRSSRRYVIVFFFIFGALLTPPDPLSQISIVIPLCLLYEFSILLIRIIK
tara:strand:+ start:192 stop:902 length:711 start_codon:yes stop_codon:yes gene_type:complete